MNQTPSQQKNTDQTPSQQQNTGRNNAEPARWRLLDLRWVKINVDGAFTLGTNNGSVTGVCGDENDVLLDGFASSIKAQSPLHVETLAVCEGLEMAAKWRKKEGSRGVAVVSDCSIAVQTILGINPPPWEVNYVVQMGRAALISNPGLRLTHEQRELNKIVD